MNTIIEKIRAKVESKIRDTNNDTSVGAMESLTISKTLRNVLSILSDLEKEEKPTPADGLEEEIERYLHSLGVGYGGWVDGMEDDDLRGIARHFAQWGAEHLKK